MRLTDKSNSGFHCVPFFICKKKDELSPYHKTQIGDNNHNKCQNNVPHNGHRDTTDATSNNESFNKQTNGFHFCYLYK